jgi:vancomycin aglycone glucosyltransferase
MRVLLSSRGTRGDVEPLVALAVRLRALGAEVLMCAPPDYTGRLAEVDIPFLPVGRPLRKGARLAGRGPGAADFAAAEIAEQFAAIPAAIEGCDAVVATGRLSVAAVVRSVAEKAGIDRYFYAIPVPMDEPGRAQRNAGADKLFGAALNSGRAALGLPPVTDLYDYGYTVRPWLAADQVIAPLGPADQDAVQTGAWILPDERPLSPELAAFLDAGPPPVYVGFGSSPGPADAARVAIEAIRAQGRRMVLSRGWVGLDLPDDGADCLAVGEVNYQVLFNRVAAVVHAGGAGITTLAARAGVPQVVVSQVHDLPYFAGRVTDLGIGVAHDGPSPTVGSLSAALATAMGPETMARVTAVAGAMRTDGLDVAADLVLDADSRERPPVSV